MPSTHLPFLSLLASLPNGSSNLHHQLAEAPLQSPSLRPRHRKVGHARGGPERTCGGRRANHTGTKCRSVASTEKVHIHHGVARGGPERTCQSVGGRWANHAKMLQSGSRVAADGPTTQTYLNRDHAWRPMGQPHRNRVQVKAPCACSWSGKKRGVETLRSDVYVVGDWQATSRVV